MEDDSVQIAQAMEDFMTLLDGKKTELVIGAVFTLYMQIMKDYKTDPEKLGVVISDFMKVTKALLWEASNEG